VWDMDKRTPVKALKPPPGGEGDKLRGLWEVDGLLVVHTAAQDKASANRLLVLDAHTWEVVFSRTTRCPEGGFTLEGAVPYPGGGLIFTEKGHRPSATCRLLIMDLRSGETVCLAEGRHGEPVVLDDGSFVIFCKAAPSQSNWKHMLWLPPSPPDEEGTDGASSFIGRLSGRWRRRELPMFDPWGSRYDKPALALSGSRLVSKAEQDSRLGSGTTRYIWWAGLGGEAGAWWGAAGHPDR
jgi:hypothetical protein